MDSAAARHCTVSLPTRYRPEKSVGQQKYNAMTASAARHTKCCFDCESELHQDDFGAERAFLLAMGYPITFGTLK